jgi:hypothetical protein
MQKKIYTAFIISLISLTVLATQNRKVLVIGIDGVRSDALQQAATPNIDSLIATGLYTYDAWHCGITVSGPSWSTIMTGVWWNKHGVSSNAYTGSHFDDYPYFTTRAKELLPNLKCVQVVEWAPMSDNVYNDGWNLKLKTPDGDGASTEAVASAQLQDPDLDCMFVYFDAADLAGHSSGFSPSNPSYMQAIENIDGHIGGLMNTLHARPNYANENWLVLIITDHGGRGTGHGGISFEERHIWWVGSGQAVTHQQITAADPGTYNLLGTGIYNKPGVDTTLLKLSPVQADIAVTALHHLIYETGVRPEERWDLDGKSWLAAFSDVKDANEEDNLKVYPNPTTGITTFWFENSSNQKVTLQIFDLQGQLVASVNDAAVVNKISINLTNVSCGNYLAKLQIGAQTLTRKIIVEH